MYTAKLETKITYEGGWERERLALRTADVWVYNSTVYNAKGTTWSGSPLWKQARQEVRQHWFIYSYIAAYKQALYMYCPVLLEYTRLVWPPTRGVGRCPQYDISLPICLYAVQWLYILQRCWAMAAWYFHGALTYMISIYGIYFNKMYFSGAYCTALL